MVKLSVQFAFPVQTVAQDTSKALTADTVYDERVERLH